MYQFKEIVSAAMHLNTATQIEYRKRNAEHTDTEQRHAQVLCVAEEAGEFVGAYRRFMGMARRRGSHEEMSLELADVVISAFVAADICGIDLVDSIDFKLAKIFSRGWSE